MIRKDVINYGTKCMFVEKKSLSNSNVYAVVVVRGKMFFQCLAKLLLYSNGMMQLLTFILDLLTKKLKPIKFEGLLCSILSHYF